MSREWKPGDVAMVTIRGVEFVAIRRYGGWTTAYGHDDHEPRLNPIDDARPLVVIDPESEFDATRLVDLYRTIWEGPEAHTSVSAMQTALREFANPTPPKPVVTAEMVDAMRKQIALDRKHSAYWKGEPHESKLDAAEAWLDSLAEWLDADR